MTASARLPVRPDEVFHERVASAVGEGSIAAQLVHTLLADDRWERLGAPDLSPA